MRIRWTVTLVSMLACATALAGITLDNQVESAFGIVTGRVETIEGQSDVTKAEKAERRRLRQAGKKLDLYSGDDTKKSLMKAALAVKFIARSKSSQTDVTECVDDLLDALQNVAAGARADALAYTWPASKTSKCRRKYDIAMGSGDRLTASASSKRSINPGKSAALTVRAAAAFWKALAKAKACATQVPAGVYVYNSLLFNDLDRDVEVNDIVFYLSGALGGEPLDYVGRGTDITPGSFSFTVPAGTWRDLAPLVMGMVLADPSLPTWQMGDFVNSAFLIETSEGDITSF